MNLSIPNNSNTLQNTLSNNTDTIIQASDNYITQDPILSNVFPNATIESPPCVVSMGQSSAVLRASKTKSIRKVRPKETPFEFKATASTDVIDNPDWINLISQSKGKNKKLKNHKTSGVHHACRDMPSSPSKTWDFNL